MFHLNLYFKKSLLENYNKKMKLYKNYLKNKTIIDDLCYGRLDGSIETSLACMGAIFTYSCTL